MTASGISVYRAYIRMGAEYKDNCVEVQQELYKYKFTCDVMYMFLDAAKKCWAISSLS